MLDKMKSARGIYPWDKWTNGKPWLAANGRDFRCSRQAFRQAVYAHAKRIKTTVTVSYHGAKNVMFQFGKAK